MDSAQLPTVEDIVREMGQEVDLEAMKSSLIEVLTKQNHICFGKAAYELRAQYEEKGLGDQAVRRKIVEFLSDAKQNADILIDLQMSIMMAAVGQNIITLDEMVMPAEGTDPLAKVHPEAAAILADVACLDTKHAEWINEISGNEDLLNEMVALPRYAKGLDFIDYDPNATNPLDRFWVGGQG